jgi:hypothetical protein
VGDEGDAGKNESNVEKNVAVSLASDSSDHENNSIM